MKLFTLEIQKGLTELEEFVAIKQARSFISRVLDDNMNYGKYTCAGYRSYLKRGTFGKLLTNNLVFRRMARKRRVFGIVRANTLVDRDTGSEIDTKQCTCPIHLGSTKVKWKTKKPETYVYSSIMDEKESK